MITIMMITITIIVSAITVHVQSSEMFEVIGIGGT
jgi:hypothetical protein